MDKQCSAVTRSGEKCRRSVDGAHGFCWGHAPENAEQRRRQASRAGSAKPSREARLLKEEIKQAISEVKAGELDRNDAAVMLQGYRVLQGYLELERKVRETDELAAEIEELKREYGRAS